MDIAQGRHLARMTTSKSLDYLLVIVAVATVVVIAVTGLQEVNDRRHESGIMIAMGVSQIYIVALYLAKTLILAVAASVAGFLLGSYLAVRLTEPFLVVNTARVAVLWEHLPIAIGLTSVVALVAELLPVFRLLSLDPNTILAEQ
jgi:ABC-type antimicrobial peptide transport system permease subunit